MDMAACGICGKIFAATGRVACQTCQKLLDIVYEKARVYLRNNPKATLKAPELAKAIKEEVRLVEILVAEGRFEKSKESSDEEGEKKRRKLLAEIKKNLAMPAEKAQPFVTYGKDRHGRNG